MIYKTTKRFKLFELDKNDKFILTEIEKDTVSECILGSIDLGLSSWTVYDSIKKKACKISFSSKEKFKPDIPFIRIAGQKIEVGKTVRIPQATILKRNKKPITFWNRKTLNDSIKQSYEGNKVKLKNYTFLEECRILSIDSKSVTLEATQLSATTLRSELEYGTRNSYEDNLIPFNFKKVKVKLKREENRILFI